jgi:hypothetical protein
VHLCPSGRIPKLWRTTGDITEHSTSNFSTWFAFTWRIERILIVSPGDKGGGELDHLPSNPRYCVYSSQSSRRQREFNTTCQCRCANCVSPNCTAYETQLFTHLFISFSAVPQGRQKWSGYFMWFCSVFCKVQWQMESCGSAVGIATGYGLDDRGSGFRVLVGTRFYSPPHHPYRFWGPSSLLSNDYGGPFSGDNAAVAWSWQLTSD